MSSKIAAAAMAKKVAHEEQKNREWAATPFEADYAVGSDKTGWVRKNIAELRQDRHGKGHRLDARTRVTVKWAENTGDVMDKVIDQNLFLYSDPAQSATARQWHVTSTVDIVRDTRGTCRVTINDGEFAWVFSKEDGFFYVPDELLQVVEITDMCMVDAHGRTVFSRNALPTSFRKLEGKMPKAWATSNVVPDELYGCYEEGADRPLLGAFGLVRYRACEVTDPVGWEVEQTAASTSDHTSSSEGIHTVTALVAAWVTAIACLVRELITCIPCGAGHGGSVVSGLDPLVTHTQGEEAPTWQFPDNLRVYEDCRCVGREGRCTNGKHVYDHETHTVRAMRRGESYVALSYVWSEAEGSTLQRAVERVCGETKVTVFWIDQFCINQRCLAHKEEQIPKMGEVYSEATHVACLLPQVTAVLPAEVREPSMVMPRREYAQATATFRAQVKASAWFTRVWTWQEGLLANSSKFVTGNDILEGWLVDNILNATRLGRCGYVSHLPALPASSNIQSLSVAVSSDTQLLEVRTSDDAASREMRARWGAPRTFTLMGAVMATRRRRATVQLDQLYGLLGMVEGGGRVTVRYTNTTMEDVLTEALENGMMTAEVLTGATTCGRTGRCWLPDMRHHSSHFATGLGQLNRAGRKVEGNQEGMAIVTGLTMPSGGVWNRSGDDAGFKLRSPAGKILASSNDEVLRQLLGTPVRVVLLDDVLSHDCYATCAMMVGDGYISHRITSTRVRIEVDGMCNMREETHVVGWRLGECPK